MLYWYRVSPYTNYFISSFFRYVEIYSLSNYWLSMVSMSPNNVHIFFDDFVWVSLSLLINLCKWHSGTGKAPDQIFLSTLCTPSEGNILEFMHTFLYFSQPWEFAVPTPAIQLVYLDKIIRRNTCVLTLGFIYIKSLMVAKTLRILGLPN